MKYLIIEAYYRVKYDNDFNGYVKRNRSFITFWTQKNRNPTQLHRFCQKNRMQCLNFTAKKKKSTTYTTKN